MKLVLIRHCETDWNAAGRMQGHTNTLLNETGRQQALDLAGQLDSLGIVRIYSSDLQRAVQTSQIISMSTGVPMEIDQRIRECRFGSLEGKTFAEAVQTYPNPYLYPFSARFYTSEDEPYDFTGYGGESRHAVVARHLEFVADMKKKHPNEVILAIGHGTGFNTLLSALGQAPDLVRGKLRFLEV